MTKIILITIVSLVLTLRAEAVHTAKARVCQPINTKVWRALDTALSKTRFGNKNKYKLLRLAGFYDASIYEPLGADDPIPTVREDSINVDSDFYVVVYSGTVIHNEECLEDVATYNGMDYEVAKGVEGQLTKYIKTTNVPSHEEFYNANSRRIFAEITKEPILLKWNHKTQSFTRVRITLELGKIYWLIME